MKEYIARSPGLFEGKVAFMGGAGSVAPGWSIGKACSMAYAREGAAVVCADLKQEAADDIAHLIEKEGGKAIAIALDVSKQDQVEAAVAKALQAYGRIDILQNNAGLGILGGAVDLAPDDWQRAFEVNVTAVMLAAKAVLPGMIERGSGVITSVSSIAGFRHVGFPYISYGATKAAMAHVTKLIALDDAADGIRANTIVPGLIDTPRIEFTVRTARPDLSFDEVRAKRDAQVPMGRMGTAWEIAEVAVFLASDAARYVTGTDMFVDGGLVATVRG